MEDFHIVIKYGNYQLAEKIMEIVTKLDGSGFNFLHREVLNSENQPLSSFRSPSVTKKPQVSRYVSFFIQKTNSGDSPSESILEY